MIVVYHKNNQVTKIVANNIENIPFQPQQTIAKNLISVAKQFPESSIYWCHELYENNLNSTDYEQYFHHHKMMLSYNPSHSNYFPESIGYIEQSPFINVNKKVRYPTWQMSSVAGMIHASVLVSLKEVVKPVVDFDYFLNSLAKLAMPKGLFCYSEPKLLDGFKDDNKTRKSSNRSLYKFVKQHYKLRWLFLLFLNELIYERKISLLPFMNALFYKSRRRNTVDLETIVVNSSLKTIDAATIDVIIPTIGRKKYVYDVLCDLRKQTHLPINVIIVEQNPQPNSTSELDYLESEDWPFTIKHTFTHQAGACNARNIALSQVESEWVFFADDDIKFNNNLIEKAILNLEKYCVEALITSCLKPKEKIKYKDISQTTIFGSGFSFVKSTCLKEISFNMAFEFGYGEDTDFGLQLRNKGYDIIYFPRLKIIHLYAPMGGFRIKPTLAWDAEIIQPKPSPTIMLLKLKYDTKAQIKGYKLLLFLKLYFKGTLKKTISFYKSFQNKWNVSQVWAEKLKSQNR